MKTLYCTPCGKKHPHESWLHKSWGETQGWGCGKWWDDMVYREWTTDSIREQRKQYRKELLQPWRNGEISKEYLDAYPRQKEGMIKSGIITKEQAEKAKPVWGNDDIT